MSKSEKTYLNHIVKRWKVIKVYLRHLKNYSSFTQKHYIKEIFQP